MVRTLCFHCREGPGSILVGELRSRILRGMAKKKKKPLSIPVVVSTVRVWNSLEFYCFSSPIWQTGVVSPDALVQSGFS